MLKGVLSAYMHAFCLHGERGDDRVGGAQSPSSHEHARDCRHGRTTSLRRRGLGTCACRTSCAGDPCAGVLRARGCRGFAPECRPVTALFTRRAVLAVELLVKAGGSTLSPSGEDQPTCVLFLFATCGAALFPRCFGNASATLRSGCLPADVALYSARLSTGRPSSTCSFLLSVYTAY